MNEVWVLANATSENYGHGDTGPVVKLALIGSYGSGGVAPAFASEADALAYIKHEGRSYGASPLKLSVWQKKE